MLQAIKDGTRGWIAYVIIAVLAVPFAFFGLYQYFQPNPNPTVAEVGGAEIKRNELDQAARQQRRQLQQRMGDRFDPDRLNEDRMRRQALEQLIEQEVLKNFADEHGMTAPDGAVAERIRNNSAFQVDGEFSQERYKQVLQRNNLRVGEFENRLRSEATVNQLRNAVISSAIVTDAAIERAAAVQYQRRHLGWLRVKADALQGEIELNEGDLASFYDENKESFREPRQVRLAYITLSPETLAKDIEVTEEELRARYNEVKDQRGEPERRRVEHIQLKLSEDAGQSEAEKAREKLQSIRKQVTSGELSFEEAARQHSEDKLSAKQGGEIGMIAPGDLGGAFEDAVFDLEQGKLSEPVRTSQGVHLIRVTEVESAERPSFEAMKTELRESLLDKRVAERIANQANELKNLAYENPKSLKPSANALGLEVRETDWFSERGAGEGLASNDKVVTAAFSTRVLEEGRNSELLELDDDRRVVVRVREQQPSRIPPLEDVRDQVKERLRAQRLTELTRERGDELMARAREDGQRFAALADGEAVELNEYGWIGRQSREEAPRQIIQTAFRMSRPGDDGPTLDGTRLPGGDYAVIALRGVQDGSFDGLSDEQKQQLRRALQRSNQSSSQGEFVSALREAADVTIYDERLDSDRGRGAGGM
jgi:peptidyl-prolyl cis-trans isomerase D